MYTCRNKLAYWSVPEAKRNSAYWMLGSYYRFKLLAVSYSTGSMSLSCRVQEIWSHKMTKCVQNYETWFTSRTHSSSCDRHVTVLKHVFINLNLCCIQRYKFCVCRVKGSRDTVTQIFLCALKSWKMLYFTSSPLHIWWEFHNTFTYPYEIQSLLHPMVRVSCP